MTIWDEDDPLRSAKKPLRQAPEPSEAGPSWWSVPMDREHFMAKAAERLPAMRCSKGAGQVAYRLLT